MRNHKGLETAVQGPSMDTPHWVVWAVMTAKGWSAGDGVGVGQMRGRCESTWSH